MNAQKTHEKIKAGDAGAAIELAAEELKEGFKRIRNIL